MNRTVILVAGPPCAGKTTWAHKHARLGDLILDQDDMTPAEFDRRARQVATMTTGTAYVIRCCGGPAARRAFTTKIRATRVVLLNPPADVLLARARQRPNPHRHVAAVRYWLDQETGRISRAGTNPQPVRRTQW